MSLSVRQGVVVRPRFTRGAHIFDFPILLAPVLSRSWRVWVAAYVLPPLLTLSIKHLVVRPAWRWHQKKKVQTIRVGSGLGCLISGCTLP